MGKFEIQDKPKFKKRFSNQVPSKTQGENGVVSEGEKPSYAKCVKKCGLISIWYEQLFWLWKEWSNGEGLPHGQDSRKGE